MSELFFMTFTDLFGDRNVVEMEMKIRISTSSYSFVQAGEITEWLVMSWVWPGSV